MPTCLICESQYQPFVDFGNMPIANAFSTKEKAENEYTFSMKVGFCENCNMVQLVEQPDREQMFHENYAFFSSTSSYMQEHFKNFAKSVIELQSLDENSFVVEIGSNDGIMLKNFAEQGIRDQALSDVYDMLKPGGIVGLVQHRAPESADDKWADGSSGYLKKSTVIDMFEHAGFKLIASSEINANALDKPVKGDIVWRLPPSLHRADEKSADELAALNAIGESDRMTLRFQKVNR